MNKRTKFGNDERSRFERGFRDGLADHGLDRRVRYPVLLAPVADPYLDGYRRGQLAGRAAEEAAITDFQTSAAAWEARTREAQ